MEGEHMQRIFMDHASTTPVSPKVLEAMMPYFSEKFANPSALYKEGVEAKEAVDRARLDIARLIHCRVDEVFFTASGTESDNMAVLGTFKKAKTLRVSRPHFVTSAIEHPAVLETVKAIEVDGGAATYVPVSEEGIIDTKALAKALAEDTVLVSVMLANNEIGTIQPVSRIARMIREFKEGKGRDKFGFPYFHVDASQAPNYLDAAVDKLGCDLMTLDGSKMSGPKGVGMLFVKKGISIEPIIYGGGQEGGLRSGTENVAHIVGFAKALALASAEREDESARLTIVRDHMIDEILKRFPQATLNGSREHRLPNNVNVCFPGLDAEFAVIQLDQKGIQCSYSSSCRTLAENSNSYVIEAIAAADPPIARAHGLGKGLGGKKECAASSLRFTFGWETMMEDIERVVEALVDIVK